MLDKTETSSLLLASSDPASLRYFATALSNFYPGLALNTMALNYDDSVPDLVQSDVDLAFSDRELHDPRVYCTHICTAVCSVSVPVAHPLFSKDQIEWSDLDGQTVLMPDETSFLIRRIAAIERAQNIKIRRATQPDYALFMNISQNTPYLHFDSTIDRITTRNGSRRDARIVHPTLRVGYYAVCAKDRAEGTAPRSLLPYLTMLQRYYGEAEERA
jgi:DNA-binding transcriptional LysR family regulator